ncbi:phosphodiester glycosidase family protein [Hamadaea sp. NPDC050747]|uniref:phosphodiester glycosidase family protein n=1 Tax=Hamadaea sp. NPDC050747 TaxID=3155789 RepID=UPI0033F516F5
MFPPRRFPPRRLLALSLAVTTAFAFGGVAVAQAAETQAAPAIETARTTRPVAPGVTLTSFDTVDAGGWLRADALTTDLGGGITVDYLSPGKVAADETVRQMTTHDGKATRAVAAVNGDFFDINNSGAALGIGVHSGQLVQSPTAGWSNAVGFSAEGIGRLLQVGFDGTATWDGGSVALTQFNNRVQSGGIGLITPLWGDYTRQRAVDGASDVTEVTLVDNVVTAIGSAAGSGTIPAGTTILLGREAGAVALRNLAVGTHVTVAYQPKTSDGGPLYAAVGGNYLLVKDGVPQDFDDVALAARSAVGFNREGTKMYLLTIDGKQANSAGVTLGKWAQIVADFGAYNALNIDGGGSSTLLARKPGEADLTLENSPSDGSERAVANGLGLYAPVGSGKLTGYWVAPTADPAAAPGSDQVTLARPDRVFPGLTRKLTANGYDETYGPAAGTPLWRSSMVPVGWVTSDNVFHAGFPGQTTVTAFRATATGSTKLTVLGALDRIRPTVERLGLSSGSTGAFGLVGYDDAGATAPIEPGDAKLDYDHDLFEVTATPNGTLTVKPLVATGAGLITATVQGHSASVAVTVGLTDVSAATFDDAAKWTVTTARASATIAPTPDGHTGQGIKLSYDFTQSTATRAAYANPPTQFTIDGQPQGFGLWIYGNGKGEWPALEFYDGLGQAQILRSDYITWTGWKYVEFKVPVGVAYPLKLRRFYVVETKAAAQYKGEVIIDDLVAKVPPTVVSPAVPKVVDPIVGRFGAVNSKDWRFAVMSDSQFVARSPDSDIVRNARRTLREIKAAKPDFLIIDGDFVDEASPADIAFAKQILDEELGGELPYYYVPGNHEVMGGPIGNFQAVFGDTHRVFDHNGTRFVTLDTSALSIRSSGYDQYALLRSALDSAAADPAIGSVVLVEHVPPQDPTPGKGSQLNDRKEAGLIEKWLADFQTTTGKGAAFLGGHVGTFHASRVDGVPYFINGNSGKNPATPADDGGFTGWTLWGVDKVTHPRPYTGLPLVPCGPGQWLTAQVNPHVDGLSVTVPAVTVGASVDVSASLTQPGGRVVPVAYPVSFAWTGGAGLHIGPRRTADSGDIAAFDPPTGQLTGLRAGTATLAVTVNGVTQEVVVTVS